MYETAAAQPESLVTEVPVAKTNPFQYLPRRQAEMNLVHAAAA